MARTNQTSSTVLIVLMMIITFPVWLALGGALVGIVAGIFGALIGVMAALIALPFKLLFGWGHWGWHGFPHFHLNGCIGLFLIIIVALALRERNRRAN